MNIAGSSASDGASSADLAAIQKLLGRGENDFEPAFSTEEGAEDNIEAVVNRE